MQLPASLQMQVLKESGIVALADYREQDDSSKPTSENSSKIKISSSEHSKYTKYLYQFIFVYSTGGVFLH